MVSVDGPGHATATAVAAAPDALAAHIGPIGVGSPAHVVGFGGGARSSTIAVRPGITARSATVPTTAVGSASSTSRQ